MKNNLVKEVLAGKDIRIVFFENKQNFKEKTIEDLKSFMEIVDTLHQMKMPFIPSNIVADVEEELNRRQLSE